MSDQTSRKTPWVLVASFALNGLLIGVLAMALAFGGPRHRGGGPPSGPGDVAGGDRALARAILQSAPASDRPEFRRIMGEAWRSTAADRKIIRDAQRTIGEQINAEEFDIETVEQAFLEWRAADTRIKESVQGAMVKVVSSLPDESRAELAEIMRRHEKRRQRFRDRVRDRMDDRRGD